VNNRLWPVVLMVVCATIPAFAAAADGGDVFAQNCLACHGSGGEGIENLGANLRDSAFVRDTAAAALVEFLRVGRFPDDPASATGRPMPGFGWLTDGELEAVAAFIKSRSSAP